eukprot:1927794-Rhodomonas_salina.2
MEIMKRVKKVPSSLHLTPFATHARDRPGTHASMHCKNFHPCMPNLKAGSQKNLSSMEFRRGVRKEFKICLLTEHTAEHCALSLHLDAYSMHWRNATSTHHDRAAQRMIFLARVRPGK